MKPRTKAHIRIVEMSKYVSYVSKEVGNWAKKECLEHRAAATKSKVLCFDCGEVFSPDLVSRNKATCPNCKTKVQVKKSLKTTDNQVNYFAITEIIAEYQVVRNFEIKAFYKKGKPADYCIKEILQYWIQPDKKYFMFGLSHNTQGFCDSWSGEMEIRTESNSYYSRGKYDVYARMYYPGSLVKNEYKKYGIDYNLKGISFLDAIRLLPNNPKSETLLKAKEYELLALYNDKSYLINTYWDTIKICFRNKFKIKDTSMYFDYLDLLKYFKKDLYSSKYVCPKNLHSEHNKLMKKKREILRLQAIEDEKLKVIKRQQKLEQAIVQYIERNQKFFDLEFTKGNISISVLKSIDEFKEEGDELKHCVYTNGYYLKEKSLILSAKVDGKRAETIELKLPELKIEQSRGLNNESTPHHDDILNIVKNNLNKIRKIVVKKRPSVKQKAVA